MTAQDAIFQSDEGDAWFARNRAVLGRPKAVRNDPVLQLLRRNKVRPETVLEVGCANGWRLEALRQEADAECTGVDVSELAIDDGRERYPALDLRVGSAARLPVSGRFVLVVVYFVLHWVDRRTLLQSLAEIDRRVADGGYLVIGDFAPPAPTAVPYHHREGLRTYQAHYPHALYALGLYDAVDDLLFDHPGGGGQYPSLAGCALLKRKVQ